jgi:hypothetical protein
MTSSASSSFSAAPDPSPGRPSARPHAWTRSASSARRRYRPRIPRAWPNAASRPPASPCGSEHTRLADREARQPTPVLVLAGELETALHVGSRGRRVPGFGLRAPEAREQVAEQGRHLSARQVPRDVHVVDIEAQLSAEPAPRPRLRLFRGSLGHRASPTKPWWLQRSRNGGATSAPQAARNPTNGATR